jgi:hypothetical protein
MVMRLHLARLAHRLPSLRQSGDHWNTEQKGQHMKSKEQFALALRIIGVLGIMYILRSFIRNTSPAIVVLIIRLVCVVIGVYLIRGAPQLVRFAYPESTPEPPEKTNA